MKAVYLYSESSSKGYWPEFYKEWKYSKNDRGDIHVEYISFCHKQEMIDIIGRRSGKNWVKERIGRTSNKEQIRIAKENIGYIVVIENENGRDDVIIAKIPLSDRPEKEPVQKRKKVSINQLFSNLLRENSELKKQVAELMSNFKFPEIDPKVFEAHKLEAFKRFVAAGIESPSFTDGWNACYEFLRKQTELNK